MIRPLALGHVGRTPRALDRAARAWGRAGFLYGGRWAVALAPWPTRKVDACETK